MIRTRRRGRKARAEHLICFKDLSISVTQGLKFFVCKHERKARARVLFADKHESATAQVCVFKDGKQIPDYAEEDAILS